jgi:psp operon transcriptional activator
VDFNGVVSELEKKLIEAALETCRGHQKKAAEHLGLSYHQMRGLLRKYGYGREGAPSGTEGGPDADTAANEN